MTVLKDASATSIYGSRGANGVILITTKQGKSGKTKFDVSMQRGTSQVLLDDRNRPLATPELAELLIESRVNNGDTPQEAEDYIYSRIDESINTNWFDVITRDGTYQQYYISASGGNEKTNFYSSIGYYDQEAPIIGIDYEKLNAKVNGAKRNDGERECYDHRGGHDCKYLGVRLLGMAHCACRLAQRSLHW